MRNSKKKAANIDDTIKIYATKMKDRPTEIHYNTIKLPPPRPMKLQVRFPLLDGPRHISQAKLNRLIDHVRKMSNREFEFNFVTPDFMEITK